MIEELLNILKNVFLDKIIVILIIMVLTVIFANLLNRALKKSYERGVAKRKEQENSGRITVHISKTKFNLLRRFLVSIVYIFGILLIASYIPELKKVSYSIFAGAGVLAIIIGFATQEVFSNIVAGIFISIFQPFRIDDRVSIGEEKGWVEDITFWHTIIKDFNNQRIMIPNSIIAKEKIINNTITDEKTLNFIDFGISYDSDFDLAKKIISEEVLKSPYYIDIREEHRHLAKEDPFKIRMISHGDFSIGLRLYAWTKNSTDGFFMKCELLESVKKRFDKEGVEIPFPYRTLVEKKNLPKNRKLNKK